MNKYFGWSGGQGQLPGETGGWLDFDFMPFCLFFLNT
jgi:hypothetical protein